MTIGDLETLCSDQRTYSTFEKAYKESEELIGSCRKIINAYLAREKLECSQFCIVAVGSIGRREALCASDVDAIPLVGNGFDLAAFSPHDKAIRAALAKELTRKVSKGEDLTRPTLLRDLLAEESIGGEKDDASSLTRRVLILTEGAQIGGTYPLASVREGLLEAYGRSSRTSGRHVLTLCNDLVRYYRTLCIDYKAKVDVEGKDWATRNLKLRHSRKVWHFANMVALVDLARNNHQGDASYREALTKCFEKPPVFRLASAVGDRHRGRTAAILKHFGLFLECMADHDRRKAIAAVEHDDRYEQTGDNAYLPMKLNSDIMHREILALIGELDGHMRQKLMDWFLL